MALVVAVISVPVANIIVYALAVEIGQALGARQPSAGEDALADGHPGPALVGMLTIAYLAISAGPGGAVYRGVLLRIVALRTAWSWRYLRCACRRCCSGLSGRAGRRW